MIAMASNWEEKLSPRKCEKKCNPQIWTTSFPHLLALSIAEKILKTKAMITCKRPTTVGIKLTNYKYLALSKTKK